MSKGQVAKVFCPNNVDRGHEKNVFTTTGAGWIEDGTDIVYDIEVLGCDVDPEGD